MKLLLATRNPGKVAEIRALLSDLPLEIVTPELFEGLTPVVEDRPTLEGNAIKKAEHLLRLTGLCALADDTGLEVRALGGAPGVRSARFAGEAADDAANRRLLLERLGDSAERGARFRTVMALAEPGADVRLFEGVCDGRIIHDERGSGGFGYDAVFVPQGRKQTFAELSRDEKNTISHRGRALRAVAAYLSARYGLQGDRSVDGGRKP